MTFPGLSENLFLFDLLVKSFSGQLCYSFPPPRPRSRSRAFPGRAANPGLSSVRRGSYPPPSSAPHSTVLPRWRFDAGFRYPSRHSSLLLGWMWLSPPVTCHPFARHVLGPSLFFLSTTLLLQDPGKLRILRVWVGALLLSVFLTLKSSDLKDITFLFPPPSCIRKILSLGGPL